MSDARDFDLPRDDQMRCAALRTMFEGIRRRTLVMGILNVTPDSFSDGGQFRDAGDAVLAARKMAEAGADIIDVGGESTRPGAEPVPEDEEIGRVVPVIEALASAADVPVSIDTSKSGVARRALEAGACIVNDVSGLQNDPEIASVAAEHRTPLVIMHMKGTPRTMQQDPRYDDLMGEIAAFLEKQIALAASRGLPRELTIIDPGFGFGKTPGQNLTLLRRLKDLTRIGRPLLIGTSRKSTLGVVLGGADVSQRMEATAATVAIAIAHGANIVRVHDVPEMVRVARTVDAVFATGGDL